MGIIITFITLVNDLSAETQGWTLHWREAIYKADKYEGLQRPHPLGKYM